MKQVWKRRAVVAAVLLLVGTSVYLNWRYAGNVEDSGKKTAMVMAVPMKSTEPVMIEPTPIFRSILDGIMPRY